LVVLISRNDHIVSEIGIKKLYTF